MKPRAAALATGVLLVSLLLATSARAQRSRASSLTADAAPSPSNEDVDSSDGVAALTREIDALHARLGQELSTHACDEACRALASMRRAAERLCALDSGPRCVEARSRCDGAAAQVREVCPECAIAASTPKDERAITGAPKDSAASEPSLARESTRGGCASCSAASGAGDFGDACAVGVGLALSAAVARRRRHRPRSPGSRAKR